MIDLQIMTGIETKLKELSWANLVTWKKIRIANSDFRETEFPAIQFYDAGQSIQHEAARLSVTWRISVEVLLKSKSSGELDMGDLFEKRQAVEQKIGEVPNLGIPGLIHIRYVGNVTDLHTIMPVYYARLDLEILYYKPYVGNC